MGIKKALGSISPLAGAITGEGLFGRLRDISPAMMAIDELAEDKKKKRAKTTMRKGGKVRGCGCAQRGLTKGKMR